MHSEALSNFIKNNITQIESNNFPELYISAVDLLPLEDVGKLTDLLYSIGVDPLLHCNYVPHHFMTYSHSTTVVIPENITRISQEAFSKSSLKNIRVPKNVTNIYMSAFFDSLLLQNVIIEDGCSRIGPDAFAGCSNLKNINLGSVSKLGAGAFFGCKNLDILELPSSLTRLSSFLFDDAAIKKLVIPTSITEIGNNCFHSCTLQDVFYDGTIASLKNIAISPDGNAPIFEAVITCTDGEVRLVD